MEGIHVRMFSTQANTSQSEAICTLRRGTMCWQQNAGWLWKSFHKSAEWLTETSQAPCCCMDVNKVYTYVTEFSFCSWHCKLITITKELILMLMTDTHDWHFVFYMYLEVKVAKQWKFSGESEDSRTDVRVCFTKPGPCWLQAPNTEPISESKGHVCF